MFQQYRILITGDSECRKTNALLNLIKQQYDGNCSVIEKIYLYTKDLNEAKYHYLIKNVKNPQVLIKYWNKMQDFYKKIEEHKPERKWNVLIVFDDMMADRISNKKTNQMELFIRRRKLNIYKNLFSRYQKILE